MTTLLKILTLVGKLVGIASVIDWTGIAPKYGALIFFISSTLKDVVNRVGDWLDNQKMDGSFGKVTLLTALTALSVGVIGCASDGGGKKSKPAPGGDPCYGELGKNPPNTSDTMPVTPRKVPRTR